MKRSSNYVIVNVDDLGRILIPKKFREALGVFKSGMLSVELLNNSLKITNDCNKDYISLITEIFIKTWITCYHDHSIMIVQNGRILNVFGQMKFNYDFDYINDNLLSEISDPNFSYSNYTNVKLFQSDILYSFKAIKLSTNHGELGHLIIIDNSSIKDADLCFIFNFISSILYLN